MAERRGRYLGLLSYALIDIDLRERLAQAAFKVDWKRIERGIDYLESVHGDIRYWGTCNVRILKRSIKAAVDDPRR